MNLLNELKAVADFLKLSKKKKTQSPKEKNTASSVKTSSKGNKKKK